MVHPSIWQICSPVFNLALTSAFSSFQTLAFVRPITRPNSSIVRLPRLCRKNFPSFSSNVGTGADAGPVRFGGGFAIGGATPPVAAFFTTTGFIVAGGFGKELFTDQAFVSGEQSQNTFFARADAKSNFESVDFGIGFKPLQIARSGQNTVVANPGGQLYLNSHSPDGKVSWQLALSGNPTITAMKGDSEGNTLRCRGFDRKIGVDKLSATNLAGTPMAPIAHP
jgi:hypothetical protein